METLTVALGARAYPVHVGRGLLSHSELFLPRLTGEEVLIVTDANVAPHWLPRLLTALAGRRVLTATLPPGESQKTLAVVEKLVGQLLEARFGRNCTLVALGGGVIGDLAGFTAACYQRGVAFIQTPTTLLAQVDAAIGGKTAVNHALGKNMIGAFHQPSAVVADIDTLATLPEREFRAGLAEVIKHGLIADAGFFAWCEDHAMALLDRDPAALVHAVIVCCRIKAAIVARDERESGERALLNYGHTFAHAIEAAQRYEGWLHGEAVAAGMALAARLATARGMLPRDDAARIMRLLGRLGLPVAAPAGLAPETLRTFMARDKKNRAGRLRFVLLETIGRARLVDDVPEEALMTILTAAAGVSA
ncbi:MAG TPA: 3-dehydroquinate synthase [Gammaproteobacteria bacterium]|nr:3-dehydroquinate synthase [Gammaproteobacteria bacterium]